MWQEVASEGWSNGLRSGKVFLFCAGAASWLAVRPADLQQRQIMSHEGRKGAPTDSDTKTAFVVRRCVLFPRTAGMPGLSCDAPPAPPTPTAAHAAPSHSNSPQLENLRRWQHLNSTSMKVICHDSHVIHPPPFTPLPDNVTTSTLFFFFSSLLTSLTDP